MKFWLFLASVVLVGSSAAAVEKLQVQLLLGSLCPDCFTFIQKQVYPLYHHVKDFVDFTFIPFGKAYSTLHEDGTRTFTCQHGEADCEVSRMQLCAIALHPYDPDAIMEFIACQMAYGSDRTGETCANKARMFYFNIEICKRDRRGVDLQIQAEEDTKRVQNPLSWVPTTSFDWILDKELSSQAENDFKSVICGKINNIAPICSE